MGCKYDYIAIVGGNESGKSTFARALGEALGMQVGETSDVLTEQLARILCQMDVYAPMFSEVKECKEFIGAHKETFRDAKRELGDMLTEHNPGYMVSRCMWAGAKIIAGMRRECEVRYMCTISGHVLVVLIGRSMGELVDITPYKHIAQNVKEVLNDGTVENLIEYAGKLAAEITV